MMPDRRQHESREDLADLLRRLPPAEAERLLEVWELAGPDDPVASPKPEEVEQALGRLLSAAEASEAGEEPAENRPPVQPSRRRDRPARQPATRSRMRRFAWGAVVVVLLFGAALFWWRQPVAHVALPGERLAVVLPDGSQVELNSGARLEHRRHFGDVRRVRLRGEAFFDVAEGERPFVVETYNARVRVLGTRFSVRAWPGRYEKGTTVALETGRVALAPAGRPEQRVVMRPGETRRVAGGASGEDLGPLSGVTVAEATAWLRGDFVAKDQRLRAVLDDVERRFAVDVRLDAPALLEARYNLVLRQPESAEVVVHALAVDLGLRYRETATGYELFDDANP